MSAKTKFLLPGIVILMFTVGTTGLAWALTPIPPPGPQSSSTGVEGTIQGPPPSQPATIDIPKSGQSFSNLPTVVSGFCPSGTLVEIYKNDVFAGSVQCQNGSYSLQIDLFDGRNDLVAKVYDALNQAGPDSSTVTVNYSSAISTGNGPQVSLTTQYAKRGANPGSILSWPITLSGGTGPYAISVNWGDKTNPDLISRQIPGDLTIEHTYAQAGIYNVIIKASDANGRAAFLQLVGVGNGKVQQAGTVASLAAGAGQSGSGGSSVSRTVAYSSIGGLFVLSGVTYWLGQKHQLEAIRRRLRKGETPFN